ncbi:MAG: ribonuclease P protein component, partial [Deltaproteobacteria bacterium]|nr:ribonuclease P protein component [Deltaproteobacteria bacterium]
MEIRGPFAFPPCARLKKKREFEWVYQNGRQRYSKNFLVIALKSKTRMPRLGVT